MSLVTVRYIFYKPVPHITGAPFLWLLAPPSSLSSRPSDSLVRAVQLLSAPRLKTNAMFSGFVLISPPRATFRPGPLILCSKTPTFSAYRATTGCYGHRVCWARSSGRAHLGDSRSGLLTCCGQAGLGCRRLKAQPGWVSKVAGDTACCPGALGDGCCMWLGLLSAWRLSSKSGGRNE